MASFWKMDFVRKWIFIAVPRTKMADRSSSLASRNVGFIGAGKMGTAIIKGLINSGHVRKDNIIASAVQETSIKRLEGLGIQTTQDNSKVVTFSDIIILAVKPHIIPKVIAEVKSKIDEKKLVISVAAGLILETLEQLLPPGTRVARVMPNLPASIGCGTSAISMGSATSPQDGIILTTLFQTCGFVEVVPENYIDIITATTVPTYACLAIEALADGAVKMGLPRDMALRLAAQSLMCGAKLVAESGEHPAVIKDAVCSPGGTTIAGIHQLEVGGLRATLINAVEASTQRARQLGARK